MALARSNLWKIAVAGYPALTGTVDIGGYQWDEKQRRWIERPATVPPLRGVPGPKPAIEKGGQNPTSRITLHPT